MRWAGHVAHSARIKVRSGLGCGNLKERDYLEDLTVEGMILKWVLKKQNGRTWTGLIWLSIGISGGHERSRYIK